MCDIETKTANCRKKKRYASRKLARIQAERSGAKYKSKFDYYRCPICRFWHLTTRKKRVKVV